MQKKSGGEVKRVVYFDYLRIVAIAAVVLLHVAAQNWYIVNTSSFEWNTFNIYDSLVRWGVPVFVMISGALFLGKEQAIGKLYKKNILKILILLVVWTVIYSFWQLISTNEIQAPRDFVVYLLKGPYFLWFLYMLIGLYMIVPFLRKIVENKRIMQYFLVLAFVFAILIPQVTQIIALKSELISEIINYKLDMMRLFMVLGFVWYFVLGYYLHNAKINKKIEIIIYIMGIIGGIFTIIASALLSNIDGVANALFYNNLTINVTLMSVAVFVFFKKHVTIKNPTKKKKERLELMSRCSLGVYLVHMIVLDSFNLVIGFNSLSFNPIISVPVLTIATLAVSYLIAIVLYKIPQIGRWIV